VIAAVAKLAMTRDGWIGEEYSAMDKTPQNQNSKNAEIESAAIGEPLKTTDNANLGEETTMKRRRALIAGLAAVPVLITLKSRSAFAAEATCSVRLSISLEGSSRHPGLPIDNADINPKAQQDINPKAKQDKRHGTDAAIGNAETNGCENP